MKEIKLTQGKIALVDDDDFEDLDKYKWRAWFSVKTKTFYARRSEKKCEYIERQNRKVVFLHRYIMKLKHKDGKIVDHINRDTLDNRKCNLRICTFSENQRNSKLQKNNKTGFSGISLLKDGKYKCTIKKIHLGYFADIKDAIKTRLQAEKKYYGEFSPNL